MAESPQVQHRGLAVGLSWAAYFGVSEATLQVIPKCAHQWLAWKRVGPIKKVLLQRLLSSWCARLLFPSCTLGARQHVLCLAQGCVRSCRVGGTEPGKGCVIPLRAVSQVSLPARGQFSVCLRGTSFLHIFDCHVWLTLGQRLKTSPPRDSRHNQLLCSCVDMSLS